jgi:two-component system chemotaxis response regulator CheB
MAACANRSAFMNSPSSPSAKRENRGRQPIRVFIVDDSVTVRTVFARIVGGEDDLDLVGQAGTAEQALHLLPHSPCDVLLLDLEMPGIGGLGALPAILEKPAAPKVLVISSLTEEGAEHTVAALSMGAADTMLKPRPGAFDAAYAASLLARIRALGTDRCPLGIRHAETPPKPLAPRRDPRILGIGSSTGGISALNLLLRHLPPVVDLPILVTQHLPASFMPVFARQLAAVSGRETLLGDAGMTLAPGQIIVAPGHAHLTVQKRGTSYVTALSYAPARSGCCPSVDPMLASLAEATQGAACGIMLSGMGRDGCEGAAALHGSGGAVLAQDSASAAVWGMPRAVIEAGLASAVLPPEGLARHVARMARTLA